MAIGLSIHIGVNSVDAEHYGSRHSLPFCVNDALAMQRIAEHNHFESCILLNEEATSHKLFYALSEAAYRLREDDIFLVSFSGHGSFFQDLNGDEPDGNDEALVLYDRMVVDDELYAAWSRFRPGVRVLFICDSCHSGSSTKGLVATMLQDWFGDRKTICNEFTEGVYSNNKHLYDRLLKDIPAQPHSAVESSVLLLSACQDDETASAGKGSEMHLSLFTEALVRAWAGGAFTGSYKDFFQEIRRELKGLRGAQKPNYYFIGRQHPFFEQQIPFSI